MEYKLDNCTYPVIIEKKGNKNTYIRVKDDLSIHITTHYFVTNNYIKKILENNEKYLRKMIDKKQKENDKKDKFYYLGKKYDIIIVPTINNIEVLDNKILVKDMGVFNRWYKKTILKLYSERLEYNYNRFNQPINYPKLKIRNMKTRWGVCNRKNESITLNSRLIEYDIDKLDYVIIHELCHFIHFDHSHNFWNLVNKYIPNYKEIRKQLKE